MDDTNREEIKQQAKRQEHDRELLALLLMLSLTDFFDNIRQIAAQTNPGFHLRIKEEFETLKTAMVQTSITAFQKARQRVLEQVVQGMADEKIAAALRGPDLGDLAEPLSETVKEALRKKYDISVGEMVQTLYEFVAHHPVVDSPRPLPAALIKALEKMGLLGDKSLIRALADTITHNVYTDGLFFGAEDSVLKSVFKGWEYVSMRDDRVRPRHEEEDGEFAPPGDTKRIEEFRSLLKDWGCRCTVVAIFGPPDEPPTLI